MRLNREAEAAYRLQDYSRKPGVEGFELRDLKRFNDDGGAMMELGRLDRGDLIGFDGFHVAQVNCSTLEPGTIKAFHVHRRQTDLWFVPPEDRILLVVADVREGSRTEGNLLRVVLGDGHARLARIPPGVAHGCRNLATTRGRIVYFTSLHFSPDPSECDEGRLPWDHFGGEVWETVKD